MFAARARDESAPGKRLTPAQAGWLGAAALGGALGLLPGTAGALDPVTLLGWLALFAPAAGVACGAVGLRPWPYGFAAPGLWTFLVGWADTSSDRDLPHPLWSALALAGLFAAGMGVGALLPRRPAAGAGAVLLGGLLLTGISVQGGLGAGGESWARTHPRFAALALDVSPPALVLDTAGWDWAHRNPLVYAASGVEWSPRVPYRGARWGPLLFGFGWLLGELFTRRAARRSDLL